MPARAAALDTTIQSQSRKMRHPARALVEAAVNQYKKLCNIPQLISATANKLQQMFAVNVSQG